MNRSHKFDALMRFDAFVWKLRVNIALNEAVIICIQEFNSNVTSGSIAAVEYFESMAFTDLKKVRAEICPCLRFSHARFFQKQALCQL